MRCKKLIQFILLLVPALLKSQTYPFTTYGVQDGLAQSNVSAIVQDAQGYLWIATESGVSRFDGKNFTNYTTENGLADNNVSCLLLDKRGILWLGHESGMLTKFDGVNFTAIQNEGLPKDKKIVALFEDKAGSLWISTWSSGAIMVTDPSRINDKSAYKNYSSKEGLGQYVFSFSEDKNGKLWCLTEVGIKSFDKKNGTFDFFRPNGMPLGQVTSFTIDSEGNFLIGTSNGSIAKYMPAIKLFETINDPQMMLNSFSGVVTNNFVYTIYEDSQRNIWASVFNFGLCRFTPSTKKLTWFNAQNGLAVNKIKSISEDREGNILLGTVGEGMQIFKGEKFIGYTKRDGLVNNQIWAISRDNSGNYWFGTNEGISILNTKEKTPGKNFINMPVIPGSMANNVRSIVTDKKGNLWLGIWGGKIVKYDAVQNQFLTVPALNESINEFVSCLFIDSKNRLWVGTIDGITVFDLSSETTKSIRTVNGLGDNDVTCIFEDSKGKMWIGTKQKGLSVFDGSSFQYFNSTNGLTHNSVTSIAEDKTGKVWVGTEGGGAFVYTNGNFTKYKVQNGLLSDFITLVTVDEKNNVWLGTNKGLSKFNSEKNTFHSYQKNDGFTGIETKSKSVFKDTEGKIWFGTVNGVFMYDPMYDRPVNLEPLTQIIKLKINDTETPVSTSFNLSYKENSLYFEYVGISFSNPEEVKYRYMLEGYDNDWKPATRQNFEVYSNLPPGNYAFKIIACNADEVCNAHPLSIAIKITPPFWKTWWFYVLVAIIAFAGVFSFIKIRERNLIIEKRILEEKVKERTAEVVQKNIELDEKNKDITASIRYAKRIQDAILPPDEFVKTYLPKTFILFKPKDIVSGDFYWLTPTFDSPAKSKEEIAKKQPTGVLFAAVDCTGHGVPGAFMSIVGHNLLDQVVSEHGITEPAEILNELNKSVSETLRQSYVEDNAVKDGMDIAICRFDRKTSVLDYAGAYNPLWHIRNGVITEYKANKFPIGNLKSGENKKFTNHSIKLEKGDTLYIFSDGFADQFGGPDGKKFKYNALKQLLLNNQHLSMEEQGALLETSIEKWRGDLEQVDDILVIGTRL